MCPLITNPTAIGSIFRRVLGADSRDSLSQQGTSPLTHTAVARHSTNHSSQQHCKLTIHFHNDNVPNSFPAFNIDTIQGISDERSSAEPSLMRDISSDSTQSKSTRRSVECRSPEFEKLAWSSTTPKGWLERTEPLESPSTSEVVDTYLLRHRVVRYKSLRSRSTSCANSCITIAALLSCEVWR